jgi:hypothetical protein
MLARTLAGAAFAMTLLAMAPVAMTAAQGSPSVRSVKCTVRGDSIPGIASSHVLSTRGEVIVYRTRGRLFDTLWACTRGHGRGVAIGRDESHQAGEDVGNQYGPELTLGPVQVADNWALVTQEKGSAQEAACVKYMAPCPGRSDTLVHRRRDEAHAVAGEVLAFVAVTGFRLGGWGRGSRSAAV